MRGDADVAVTQDEDERDPLVPGDLLRCLTNEVQRRAKRVRCNAGLGSRDCRECHSPMEEEVSIDVVASAEKLKCGPQYTAVDDVRRRLTLGDAELEVWTHLVGLDIGECAIATALDIPRESFEQRLGQCLGNLVMMHDGGKGAIDRIGFRPPRIGKVKAPLQISEAVAALADVDSIVRHAAEGIDGARMFAHAPR